MNETKLVAASLLFLAACAAQAQSSSPSATATLRPASGSQVQGQVTFTQISANRVRVAGEVTGQQPGPKGFHIHEKGDCSAPDAASAGPHFNPAAKKHGGPESMEHHAGDLGNLNANEYGKATLSMMVDGISVGKGADGVIGRGVIVHADVDDLKTDPAGNTGGRIGCGAIEG